MPVLDDDTYQCDFCERIFGRRNNEDWNEEKAKAEFHRNFPKSDWEKRVVVCDDCYRMVRPH